MRVITGTARGHRLKTLEGEDVRPTSDRVKEAVFSIIQFEIEGRKVLDLFAGSGQIAIEALSRGAASAVLCDSSSKAVGVIRDNLSQCGMSERAVVVSGDSVSYLARCREKFDIAFIDPPYASDLVMKTLPMTAAVMNTGGTIICETPLSLELCERAGEFTMRKQYRYGKIMITVYRHESCE